jgi:hypothetical protein
MKKTLTMLALVILTLIGLIVYYALQPVEQEKRVDDPVERKVDNKVVPDAYCNVNLCKG